MLRKFKIEIEICGPAYCGPEDVSEFIESLKANKDIIEDCDIFAFGDYDIYDEGRMDITEWNGDEVSVVMPEE